ncbi:MAG: coenzyme F420-reducing hydrogenase subunit beta [Planctomycetes bacterium B3_Pla]|nr:MAG: coenzyme F420-reducing hydrogenase subunit beta [Planctomycetes bacterium B3_Pla]
MTTLPRGNCTGCSACASVCERATITMKEDAEGFLCPVINEEVCTDCGLCQRICPVLPRKWLPSRPETPAIYAAWHHDPEVRRQSSSGGVFTALAVDVLNHAGVVFGAGFDGHVNVCHKAVFEAECLEELRGSKYVQSSIGDTFSQAKKLLKTGRQVLFSGTPCQIAGLYSFLGHDCDNLVTCDFICHGVPSPKLFRKYMEYLEQKYLSKPRKVSFRDKRRGWTYLIAIEFYNGQEVVRRFTADPYYTAFLKNICLRRCCHECDFKGLPRVADVTLADFWGIGARHPELDDNKGTSLVLVNSDKGKGIYECCHRELFSHECPFDYIEGNVCLMGSVRPHPHRQKFFADLSSEPFEVLVKRHMTFPSIPRRAMCKAWRAVAKILDRGRLQSGCVMSNKGIGKVERGSVNWHRK